MAAAGRIVADTLALLGERLEPGLTMLELDAIADEYIHSRGASPTSKGYKGFPAATCISPNEMIVHGIPSSYRAAEGDIISFDVGVTQDGLIADSAATFASARSRTRRSACSTSASAALLAGIEAAQVGAVSATSPPRSSRSSRAPASPSSAASSATASAGLPRGAADAELRLRHRGSPLGRG